MANPPITVGELVDVPAPESPVNAQFHQEVAHRIIHRFATVPTKNTWAAANGSMAFVTATGTHYLRQGGAWVALALQSAVDAANANIVTTNATIATYAQGIINRVVGTDIYGVGTTVTAIPGASITWTADPARWYRTVAEIGAFRQATASGRGFAYILDSGSTQLRTANASQPVNEYASLHLEVVESGLSGSTTRRLAVSASGGVIDVFNNTTGLAPFISVEDLGAV